MSSSSRFDRRVGFSAPSQTTERAHSAGISFERSPVAQSAPQDSHQRSPSMPSPRSKSTPIPASELSTDLGEAVGPQSDHLHIPCPTIPPAGNDLTTEVHDHAHTVRRGQKELSETRTTSAETSYPPRSKSSVERIWIDPAALPAHTHPTPIGGNAPDYVKRLNYNTVMFYGVGAEGSFGEHVGRAIRFLDVSLRRASGGSDGGGEGRLEATTTAEVEVTKHMLNGAGMLHGGCVAYLIDNCCSTPLVVLGILKNVNGVGVTQSMTILFHSPAPLGTVLQIVSTSMTLGGRVMTSRCEILNKNTGRMVASAFLSKMQPAKL